MGYNGYYPFIDLEKVVLYLKYTLFEAVYVPRQGFFPKYDYGMYSSGQTTMIINAGLGESVIPFRFNMRPEIVLITLVFRL